MAPDRLPRIWLLLLGLALVPPLPATARPAASGPRPVEPGEPRTAATQGREGALERARLEQGVILAERTAVMLGELYPELATLPPGEEPPGEGGE